MCKRQYAILYSYSYTNVAFDNEFYVFSSYFSLINWNKIFCKFYAFKIFKSFLISKDPNKKIISKQETRHIVWFILIK